MSNHIEASPIRVLLVEDSLLQLHVIKTILDSEPGIHVVGTAVNGAEALKLLPDLHPDVICTDYHMPVMDGLEFIEHAVKIYPCPILVLSISVQANQTENIFKMLSAGAIDIMPKPKATGGLIGKEEGARLAEKIRILNGVKFIKKNGIRLPNPKPLQCELSRLVIPRIIVIGASTGGPQALEALFLNLNADFSIPIICVQHISNGFLVRMLDWLQSMTNLKVEIAQEKGVPMAGHLYFPPEGKHLEIGVDGGFRISSPSPGEIYCPSIDKLFASVAESCPSSSVGVILSGMGRDGAIGLKKIFDSGGDTIAQDETSSIIFGMPAAAIELGGVCHVMSVVQIAGYLNGLQPYSQAKYNANSLQPY